MMSQGSLLWQREGTIKGKHNPALGIQLLLLLSSGCFNTSIWVFTKPQTLYFGCLSAPQVGSISRMHSVVCYSISMCPYLFGGLWVILTLFIWWQPGRPLPPSPWTWYWAKHGPQPFSSKLWGWDKSLAWCESLPVYLMYLHNPAKCGPVTFLASLDGFDTSAPFLPRRESQIWFNSGSCNGVVTIP